MKLNLATRLAWRYVFSTRSRNLVHLISGISMFVIAAVTAAMVAGQDDFVDLAALKKQLSRGRAKETTLDYLRGKVHREKEGREGAPAAPEPGASAESRPLNPAEVLWRARRQLDHLGAQLAVVDPDRAAFGHRGHQRRSDPGG